MNRIELIRKFQGNDENIKFLLSKLEIAEKALEAIDAHFPSNDHFESAQYKTRVANKALEQIRT